jgi:hypothetical protein
MKRRNNVDALRGAAVRTERRFTLTKCMGVPEQSSEDVRRSDKEN